MPRSPKYRKICRFPDYFSFVPEDTEVEDIENVSMSLDEYETIKLLDYKGMNQEECAGSMGVARTTVTAIYESARKKLATAIVEGKRLSIEGGHVQIDRHKNHFGIRLDEKGEKIMRVAVTYDNGNVFEHFGRTEEFKVYDIEDGKVISSQIVGTNGEGCGALAGILNVAQVDVLICGGIGGGAQRALQEAGIRLCAGVSGNTDEAVDAFIKGTLEAGSEANCSHHEHGEGHSCGHGGCHH
ncbi:putative DNA-binding protein [Lachnospiraceae bacterium JC7]|nr:putative DNA-binding protein [Lachnospiraceae bacterium JC7]